MDAENTKTRRLMEKLQEIRLDYDTLFRMMASPDTENVSIAISLLDTVDFKKNMVLILLLYKKSHQVPEYWKKNAPKLWKKMKGAGVSEDKPLTYKDLLSIMQAKKVPEEQVAMFVQSVNDTLKNDLAQYGYDFIEIGRAHV